jgi:hypothetical protein
MQRGAHFAFSRSVPMQHDARFGIFDVSWGGPMWPSEGVRNICKTNAFFQYFENESKKEGVPEADAKALPCSVAITLNTGKR